MDYAERESSTSSELKPYEPSTNESDTQISIAWSATNTGTCVIPIRIECIQGRGFSGINMIGSAGMVCEDGKERAKAALERLGWVAPPRRLLISVSPGEAKVDSCHVDLAFSVALAGVVGSGDWKIQSSQWLFAAEVGINGELRPVSGIVGWATAAIQQGLKGIVVAKANLKELQCLSKIKCLNENDFVLHGFDTLEGVLDWLITGVSDIQIESRTHEVRIYTPNFDDMDLSPTMELLAKVVGAGMHSVLLRGSPGTGKSMFAKRIPSILPRMNQQDHLQALSLYSMTESQVDSSIIAGVPPYRSPHHFTSLSAMLGSVSRPGEMSLASGGVLFLDELPEFRRDVLEGLREPIETGDVAVSRAGGSQIWTAKVLLVAAANNCPCGWHSSKRRRCYCPASRAAAYKSRLSGPLQDRIDIHVNMEEPASQTSTLFSAPVAKKDQTLKIRDAVQIARDRAKVRNQSLNVLMNRDLSSSQILSTFGRNPTDSLKMIEKIIPNHASARSLLRCLRVARTIADVKDRDLVLVEDIEQAWEWQAWSAAVKRGDILPI